MYICPDTFDGMQTSVLNFNFDV